MDGWYGSNITVIPLLGFVYFKVSMLLHGLTISLTDSKKEPRNKTHNLTIPPTDKPPNLAKLVELW